MNVYVLIKLITNINFFIIIKGNKYEKQFLCNLFKCIYLIKFNTITINLINDIISYVIFL